MLNQSQEQELNEQLVITIFLPFRMATEKPKTKDKTRSRMSHACVYLLEEHMEWLNSTLI